MLTPSVPRDATSINGIPQLGLDLLVICLGCIIFQVERLDASLHDGLDHPEDVVDLGLFGEDDRSMASDRVGTY
jgi:hypothetical protein